MSTQDTTPPPVPESAGKPARRRTQKKSPVKRAGVAAAAPLATKPDQTFLRWNRRPVAPEGTVTVYRALKPQTANSVRYRTGEIVVGAEEWTRIDSWVRARWVEAVHLTPEELAAALRAQGVEPEQPEQSEQPEDEQDANPEDEGEQAEPEQPAEP